MRNTLGDLNNHLFAQIERLSDEDLKGKALLEEIKRSDAVSKIATNIVENAALVLKAEMAKETHFKASEEPPRMLTGK